MTASPQLLRVLRHRDFRLLWIANAASAVGDRIVTIALALFVVQLTGSATDIGIVLAAYTVPLVAFLLVGGVIADRLPRHRVAVATDLVRCTLHGLLAILIVTGEVRIWHLVAIGVVFGTAEAFFRPAAGGLLPQTVPEDEIQEANAATTMFDNVAELAGPALATALVLGLSPAAAFGLDAATFLVSAALLVRVRPRRRELHAATSPEHAGRPSVRADLRAGFHEVTSRAWVWATLASFCVLVFTMYAPFFVVGPLIADERYGDLAIFGYVSVAFGAGTIAGSLTALRWRPKHALRAGIALVLPWPAGIALYAAGLGLELVVPAMAAAGMGVALFEIWWITALAEQIPPDKLSRVIAYDHAISLALIPAGYVLAGPIANAVGAANVLFGGSLIALGALALALAPRATRTLERRSPEPATPPAVLVELPPRVPVA